MSNVMLDAALAYQARGWWVLPLKPNSKDPNHDLISNAYRSAEINNKAAMAWWLRKPEANLGIAARQSGLVILDIDYRNGGKYDKLFNMTYTVKTPDGYHLYYKHQFGDAYKSRLTGVDVKHNGYVAAAPSIHPSGELYKVIYDIEPQPLSADLREEIVK